MNCRSACKDHHGSCRSRCPGVVLIFFVGHCLALAGEPAAIPQQIQDQPHTIFFPELSPQQLSQFGEWVQNFPGLAGNSQRSLLELIRRTHQRYPTAKLEDIAQLILRENPGLQSPQGIEQLEKLFNQLQGSLRPGIAIPEPQIRPRGSKPGWFHPGEEQPSRLEPPSQQNSRRPRNLFEPKRYDEAPEPSASTSPKMSPFPGLAAWPEWIERLQSLLPGQMPLISPTPPSTTGPVPLAPPERSDDSDPRDHGGPKPYPRLPDEESPVSDAVDVASPIDLEQLAQRERQFLAIKQFWERYFGSLDETPALRALMLDLFTGENGIDAETGVTLVSLLEAPNENTPKLINWLEKVIDFDRWNPGPLSFPSFGMSTPNPTSRSGPRLPGTYSLSSFLGETLLLAIWVMLTVGVVIWLLRRGRLLTGFNNLTSPSTWQDIASWPIDPRRIQDRKDLIRAFEHLSLKACGSAAQTWHHRQIAEALRRLLSGTAAAASATPLADCYALARYSPSSEPLPAAVVAEARQHLCRIAGIATS